MPPTLFTIFTHLPPNGSGPVAHKYHRVGLQWQATLRGLPLTVPPEWERVEWAEIEARVGHDLTPRAFWQRLAIPASEGRPALVCWWCEVGRRRGDAWRIQGQSRWFGTVFDNERGEWNEDGFGSRTEAQGWVLEALAQLAEQGERGSAAG